MEERPCLMGRSLAYLMPIAATDGRRRTSGTGAVRHRTYGRLMLQVPYVVGHFVNGVDDGTRCLEQQKAVAPVVNNHSRR